MVNQTDVEAQLTEKRRRLQQRRLQQARYGISADPAILIEIEDLEAEIAGLEAELRAAEAARRPGPDQRSEASALSQDAARLLEMLALHYSSLYQLERAEAKKDALAIPLELRNNLLEQREKIDAVEARLRQVAQADASGAVAGQVRAARLAQLQAEQEHLAWLQRTRRGNVAELQKRVDMHGPGEAALALENLLAEEQKLLAAVEERWRRVAARRQELTPAPAPPPVSLALTIVTPDGDRFQTHIDSDVMVAELQAALLEAWSPPAGQPRLTRFSLRLAPEARALEPALTMAQAGVPRTATLHLVGEPLLPTSAVGLVIEGPEASRYTTAVRLDTPVRQLADAFMESLGRGGEAVVELLAGPQGRPLRPEATLYDERIGEGARLRILPLGG